MSNFEREEQILAVLKRKKTASVKELSQQLYVSEATIRRDLIRMENTGSIRRSHGGAVISDSLGNETGFYFRSQSSLKEKRIIAELAADFIRSGTTLFIDSSTTSGSVITLLDRYHHLNVITNGLHNAIHLSTHTDAAVFMAGGTINSRSNSAVGTDTINYIHKYYADIALISCNGVDTAFGITDAVPEQSQIKQAMLHHATTKILLCTSEKFGRIMMCHTANLSDFDYIITDRRPSDEFLNGKTLKNAEFIFPE